MKKRRKFTAEFKSKVALEALREQHPIHEIARRHQIIHEKEEKEIR